MLVLVYKITTTYRYKFDYLSILKRIAVPKKINKINPKKNKP